MIAYSYNPDTMEFSGTTPCQLDPVRSSLEKKEIYLLPANATFIEPPSYNKETENILWNGVIWEMKEKKAEMTEEILEESTEYIDSKITDKINKIIDSI